jgi:hypothetical protein
LKIAQENRFWGTRAFKVRWPTCVMKSR